MSIARFAFPKETLKIGHLKKKAGFASALMLGLM